MQTNEPKLKSAISETLSKYNQLLINTVAKEGFGKSQEKIILLSEIIDDLDKIRQICVNRNRF